MKPQTQKHTPTCGCGFPQSIPPHSHSPCVLWEGAFDNDGYGRKMSNGKWQPAHRVLWEKFNGKLPVGMVLDHLCRFRSCVNLTHLEPVTPRENTMRGNSPFIINKRKVVCSNGHELEGENLSIDYRGFRQCRKCGRSRWRAYRNRKIKEGTWTRSRRRKIT